MEALLQQFNSQGGKDSGYINFSAVPLHVSVKVLEFVNAETVMGKCHKLRYLTKDGTDCFSFLNNDEKPILEELSVGLKAAALEEKHMFAVPYMRGRKKSIFLLPANPEIENYWRGGVAIPESMWPNDVKKFGPSSSASSAHAQQGYQGPDQPTPGPSFIIPSSIGHDIGGGDAQHVRKEEDTVPTINNTKRRSSESMMESGSKKKK